MIYKGKVSEGLAHILYDSLQITGSLLRIGSRN